LPFLGTALWGDSGWLPWVKGKGRGWGGKGKGRDWAGRACDGHTGRMLVAAI